MVWKEDARRTPWITSPQAVYALAILRMIALNILAVLRGATRAWGQIAKALKPWMGGKGRRA